jgi:nitrate reductase molybdenum cofactor assembly chaperone NarJ/NarW
MNELRVLGALLTYPGTELRAALPELRAVLDGSRHLATARKERLRALVDAMAATDPYELEASWLGLFEGSRATSLHLFEHVHGESRDRGQALVDLAAVYERGGLVLRKGELPDYLPVLLEFLGRSDGALVEDMLGDCAHILRSIGQRLIERGSDYAVILDALLGLSREAGLDWKAAPRPVAPPPPVDEEWMDAPAFGPGCAGQAGSAGTEVPLRHMPRRAAAGGTNR